MKKIPKAIIAVSLLILLVPILFSVLRSVSDKQLLSMDEDKLYTEMEKLPTDKLISKILRLEKKFSTTEDKMVLLPLYTALMDRAEEFSAEQLIEQIKNPHTGTVADSAFVRMYAANRYPSAKLLELLESTAIDSEVKEEILVLCDFNVETLLDILQKHDGKVAEIAMRKLSSMDPSAAMNAVEELLSADNGSLSDEKYRSICLGIAAYYEKCQSPEEADNVRDAYAPIIQKIFSEIHSEPVKDQAVYALSRICDYDLFAWLIENKEIDFYLKISVIDRNYRQLLQWVAAAESEESIGAVLKAMELHPILEIGRALEEAIQNGRLPESDSLLLLISHIQSNGMNAVDKYEK